jgi:hypothetical protein
MLPFNLSLRSIAYIGTGIVIAALLAVAVAQRFEIIHLKKVVAVLRIDLTKARARTEAEIAKHQATKRAYAEAQAEAERLEKERLARVTQEQERINDEALTKYRSDIARIRAAADRLRKERRAGSVGSPTGQPMPGAEHPAGTSATAGDQGLSDDQRVIASAQAAQLDALITAVEGHMKINPN